MARLGHRGCGAFAQGGAGGNGGWGALGVRGSGCRCAEGARRVDRVRLARGAGRLRAGWATGSAGCGSGGRSPVRQALNRLSSAAKSWRRASQSRIASDRLPPACRTQATRDLMWPVTMRACWILTIDVFICDLCFRWQGENEGWPEIFLGARVGVEVVGCGRAPHPTKFLSSGTDAPGFGDEGDDAAEELAEPGAGTGGAGG